MKEEDSAVKSARVADQGSVRCDAHPVTGIQTGTELQYNTVQAKKSKI